jgi:hypothetical protein
MKAALIMCVLLITLAGAALADNEISNTQEKPGFIPAHAATWEPSDIPMPPLVGWVLTAVGAAMVLIGVRGMK